MLLCFEKNYLLFIFKLLLLVVNLLLYGGEFCQKLLLTSKALKMRYSPIFNEIESESESKTFMKEKVMPCTYAREVMAALM